MPYTTEDYAPFLDATITDDDIVAGETVMVTWPSSGDRLNHCIVKFMNEAENFKEDTAAWPLKTTMAYFKGIGGVDYSVPTYTWDVDPGTGAPGPYTILMNGTAVWTGPDDTATSLTWLVRPMESGSFGGEFATDDSGTLELRRTVDNVLIASATSGGRVTFSATLVAGVTYRINIEAQNTGERKGAAARITAPSGLTFWTTRDTSYSAFQDVEQSSEIYDLMLAEDNGVPLETTVFLEGCSDFYHARAKAEEMVRTSRSAVGISLRYIVRDKILEPGDLVKLESLSLALGDMFYIRVNEVKMDQNGTCEIKGNRFEFDQLAWLVKETELGTKTNGGVQFAP
jgi:hypothetical protein